MDGLPAQLPDDPAALKALLKKQQRLIEQQQKNLDREQKRVERFRQKAVRKQDQIELLEERLRRLLAHRFGQRSEKNPDQFQLFNEAELLAQADALVEDEAEDTISIPAHTRKRKRKPATPCRRNCRA